MNGELETNDFDCHLLSLTSRVGHQPVCTQTSVSKCNIPHDCGAEEHSGYFLIQLVLVKLSEHRFYFV